MNDTYTHVQPMGTVAYQVSIALPNELNCRLRQFNSFGNAELNCRLRQFNSLGNALDT